MSCRILRQSRSSSRLTPSTILKGLEIRPVRFPSDINLSIYPRPLNFSFPPAATSQQIWRQSNETDQQNDRVYYCDEVEDYCLDLGSVVVVVEDSHCLSYYLIQLKLIEKMYD